MADPVAQKMLGVIQQHPTGITQKELEKVVVPLKANQSSIRSLIDKKLVQAKHPPGGVGGVMFVPLSERVAMKLGTLSPDDEKVLKAIRESGDMGIWTRTIKSQTKLQVAAMNKSLKRLEGKKLIKSVKSVTFKSRKIYMLYELVPSAQVTGGAWYTDGELDTHFINSLRRSVAHFLTKSGGMKSRAEIADHVRKCGVSTIPLGASEVQQVIDTLVMDRAVRIMPPAGVGRAGPGTSGGLSLPEDDGGAAGGGGGAGSSSSSSSSSSGRGSAKAAGGGAGGKGGGASEEVRRAVASEQAMLAQVRYRRARSKQEATALTSVPCGMCPVADECTPGGSKVSPEKCVYYTKWLEAF